MLEAIGALRDSCDDAFKLTFFFAGFFSFFFMVIILSLCE
jgi:hypothetical protein